VLLAVLLYQSVLYTAFATLPCQEVARVIYLYPGIECVPGTLHPLQAVAVATIVVLSLLPLALWVWLWRWRRRGPDAVPRMLRVLGGVFVLYRQQFYYWEAVLLLRRLVLLAVFVPLLGSAAERLVLAKVLLLGAVLVFAALQLVVWPYEHWLDNVLETVSVLALALLVGLFAAGPVGVPAQGYLDAGWTVIAVMSGLLLLPKLVYWAAAARALWQEGLPTARPRPGTADRPVSTRYSFAQLSAASWAAGGGATALQARLLAEAGDGGADDL